MSLVDEQKLDLRLSGVRLLAAVPVAEARQRLVDLLTQDPTVAGAACTALIGVGADCAPMLRAVLVEPPIDRSFAYAAFVLAAGRVAADQLPEQALAGLQQQLASPDALTRSLAAVALAELCYRGRAGTGSDAAVVAVLLDVVVPGAFIPNLDILRGPAGLQLRRLTGRSGSEAVGWRDWWATARISFAGVRLHIKVDEKDVVAAVVELHDRGRPVRVLGESLANMKPRPDAAEYVLDRPAMLQFIEALETAGFMQLPGLEVPTGVPLERRLQLVISGARAEARAPATANAGFEKQVAIVERTVGAEVWQQLRHPMDEPERGPFWRSERRWLAAHPDPVARGKRLVGRALRVWNFVAPEPRSLFLAWLLAQPDRNQFVDEADGLAMLELVRGTEALTEQQLLLLELAAAAPGDRVWREAVDLASLVQGGGRGAVERLFAVLGADRVLQALDDERVRVRRAALDEVVRTRDLRARAGVLALFDDEDLSVRRAAVFAAGQLRIAEARTPLIDLIITSDDLPELRRDALVALGQVGGDGAFGVLQRALAAPLEEDRQAALRGLGELRDPRAASQLATIFVVSAGTTTGELARFYLQRMGSKLVVPALRDQLGTQNRAVRNQLILLLGGYQDPHAVPELIDLLKQQYQPLVTVAMLAATTGLDVSLPEDLVGSIEGWYREHRNEPQWLWLIHGLDRAGISHSLTPGRFAPGAGLSSVPELARIMVECELGRLRVLAAAVLRTVTGEEYGQVRPATPTQQLEDIAARYRVLYESSRAARGR